MHIVPHLLLTEWLQWNLLSVLHPGPILGKAANRLCLKWLGQGGRVARVEDGT